MKISCCFLYVISHFGYPPKLENLFKSLSMQRELGFEYVELEGIREENLREVHRSRRELRKECQNLGLKVVNFSPILPDLVSLDKQKRESSTELYKIGVELAVYLGAGTVQMDSYTPPLKFIGELPYKEAISYGKQYRVEVNPDFCWPELWDVLVDSTLKCNAMAKEANLKLVMEPRVGEIVSNSDALLRLMEVVDDTNFGAILDTAHLNAQKEILVLSVEKMGGRIYYLHVADNDGRENQHLALGDGNIDWKGLFTGLKKHRFEGYVAIDVGNVPRVDEAYRRSINFLKGIEKEVGI